MTSVNVGPASPAGLPPGPSWLWGLIRGIRRDGLQPRDQRVKTLWDLLRSKGLLGQSPWLKTGLRFIWGKGLAPRPRRGAARRLKALLRQWGILPPRVIGQSSVVVQREIIRGRRGRRLHPLRPVQVRRVGWARPVARPGRRR
jgi:hypothetical protein